MSTCPGCSKEASDRPEPHRFLTAGLNKRPPETDVCCGSGSLEMGETTKGWEKNYTSSFIHVQHGASEKCGITQ